MIKFIAAAFATSILATSVVAQTAPPPPAGPTIVECQNGYKDGMQWTKDQFEQACAKLRQGSKP